MQNNGHVSPEQFIIWAKINKWRVSTGSRREITKEVRKLFAGKHITSKQLDAYLAVKRV